MAIPGLVDSGYGPCVDRCQYDLPWILARPPIRSICFSGTNRSRTISSSLMPPTTLCMCRWKTGQLSGKPARIRPSGQKPNTLRESAGILSKPACAQSSSILKTKRMTFISWCTAAIRASLSSTTTGTGVSSRIYAGHLFSPRRLLFSCAPPG